MIFHCTQNKIPNFYHTCKVLNNWLLHSDLVPRSPLRTFSHTCSLSGLCRLQALFHFLLSIFYINDPLILSLSLDVITSESLSCQPFIKQLPSPNIPIPIFSSSTKVPVYFLHDINYIYLNLLSGILSSPLNEMSLRTGTVSVLFITSSSMSRVLMVSKYMVINICQLNASVNP